MEIIYYRREGSPSAAQQLARNEPKLTAIVADDRTAKDDTQSRLHITRLHDMLVECSILTCACGIRYGAWGKTASSSGFGIDVSRSRPDRCGSKTETTRYHVANRGASQSTNGAGI